jgi:hypothetical protein
MFEQSGIFKNEFKKLGYDAYDYDIQNNFGETDFIVDLFAEIEKAYDGKASMFDSMITDDLLIAFFPCIYFEAMQMTYYSLNCNNVRAKSDTEKVEVAIDRLAKRTKLHELLYKLVWIAYKKKLRLIIENPATAPHYLITLQNFPKPSVVDKNRMERGDYFKKPTAYWYFNCKPTYGESFQNDKEQKTIQNCKRSKGDGLCSEERSLISPDYARNFICDFIIGKQQDFGQQRLF